MITIIRAATLWSAMAFSLLLSTQLMAAEPQGKPAAIPAPAQSIASLLTDKPGYYPQCSQTPLRVGAENYQKSYLTLRGLTGMYVNIDDVLKSAAARNLKLPDTLKTAIIQRLNKAGLRLLSKEEMEKTPGQPEMSIFPSFPKHLGPFKQGEAQPEYRADCCSMGIWTSFTQGATTLRDPFTRFKSGTWGEGHNTTDCSDIANWLNGVVLKTIDDFIADKQKGEQELTAKPADSPVASKQGSSGDKGKPGKAAPTQTANIVAPVTPAETGNMECNTALMMYIELFKTGAGDIIPSKYFILDKLADTMKACPNYNYVIETHADQRADFGFNEKLTKERAQSIQQYLNFKGVNSTRFEVKWFGESRPVTMGVTEEDYAANRRVVITPYRVGAVN